MALSPNMNVMLRAAEKAGRSLVRDFGEVEQLQVSRKGPGDFVSAADKRAEEIIYESLLKTRPDYAFLMEESGEKGKDDFEYRWIIDPLDGTSNFLHGVPHWCISIALEHRKGGKAENSEIIAGLVFDPIKDDAFRAEKGNGAFIRNARLRVSGRDKLDAALITTGAPKRNTEAHSEFMAEYDAVLSKVPGMRRYGAAALDLAYVAAGRFEAYWERGVNAWDVAAGILIAKEAGAIVTNIDDLGYPLYSKQILAGNPTIHGDLKTILKNVRTKREAA